MAVLLVIGFVLSGKSCILVGGRHVSTDRLWTILIRTRMSCITDTHTLTLVVIIIGIGAFGGYLNYLHNFDTTEDKQQSNRIRNKYVLLGVGSAILVPAFFRMIASDLLRYSRPFDNINYYYTRG
jgi:hypothetical protein